MGDNSWTCPKCQKTIIDSAFGNEVGHASDCPDNPNK